MPRIQPAAMVVLALALAPMRAWGQFDSIFGPPRPPANVPDAGRPPADVPPPSGYPQSSGYPPPSNYPPPSSYPPPVSGPSGGVQARPLPPPPGVTVDPGLPQGRPNQATLASPPPGQRQPPRAAPPPDTAPPSDTAPPPEETVEPPSQRIANKNALFSGLDKITGRVINFDAAIGETVQFGALQVTVRACYTRPPTETADTDAFVEVDEVTLEGEVKRIFTGWMFAASPGLHAVEHPIYDVWLTDCKGPVQTAAAPETAPPAQTARPQPPPSPKSAQPRRPAATQPR